MFWTWQSIYTNINYRRQTSINPENQRTNTEIVAILIWFLGTCALPFLFRWASTTCALWRMFNTGTNRKAVHSELIAHVISRDFAAPWLYLCWTCVTCSVQAVLAQWNKNGSAQVPKNQMSIATISVFSDFQDWLTSINQYFVCICSVNFLCYLFGEIYLYLSWIVHTQKKSPDLRSNT